MTYRQFVTLWEDADLQAKFAYALASAIARGLATWRDFAGRLS